jgi:hypothetical protein
MPTVTWKKTKKNVVLIHHIQNKKRIQLDLRFRFFVISSHVRLKVKTPGTSLRSVIVTAGVANWDVATVVTSIRSMEPMHIGMPSLVTWTEQSITSAPSSTAF